MRSVFGMIAAAGMGAAAFAGNTNNILVTGYWPPTNEMLRAWSQNPAQNPGMWTGRNWEGRGYDIYAYFPEFPGGTGTNPKGNGDLEVDYQDTTADWAVITAAVKPVAIVTFSRANTTRGWELEPAARRFRVDGETNPPGVSVSLYTVDYLAPTRPVGLPITGDPIGNIRNNSLPMQAIVDAVAAQMTAAQVDPFIQTYDPNNPAGFDFGGAFLSGYVSYLGCWYHDEHASETDPLRCVAAGHIHVGASTTVANATQAAQITVRTLIDYVNTLVSPCPADFNDDTNVSVQDIFDFLAAYFAGSADVSGDGATTVQDIFDFLSYYFAGCA